MYIYTGMQGSSYYTNKYTFIWFYVMAVCSDSVWGKIIIEGVHFGWMGHSNTYDSVMGSCNRFPLWMESNVSFLPTFRFIRQCP